MRPRPPAATGPRPSASAAPGADRRRIVWFVALLFVAAAGLFLPAVGHDFITYDDPGYVTGNPMVQRGLSWEGVRWAFTTGTASNWHPLTWLSHQLDCTLYGLRPGGHHLTNVLLHGANAALLFLALHRLTRTFWRSALVAAWFAWHPLHVESVAWVAERKDVLSTFFGLLALAGYAEYAARRDDGRPRAAIWYAASLGGFAASLLSKPMLVTLPCLLLLLDAWPLRRLGWPDGPVRWRVVLEKLPFAALTAASSAVTYLVQQHGGAVKTADDFAWPVRLANAAVAYLGYLTRCFHPVDLAVYYPNFGEFPPAARLAAAVAVLAAGSLLAFRWRRSQPWVFTGWWWFVGTLVPVIGLVQIGGAALADRYSYIPLTGIFIVVAWALAGFAGTSAARRRLAALLALASLAACGVLTTRQLAHWENGLTLFRHALRVTQDNWIAHVNLALTLGQSPATAAESRAEMQRAVAIIARLADRHFRRGQELAALPGRRAEAIAAYRKAIRIKGDVAEAHFALGRLLAGDPADRTEAAECFRAAVRFQPGWVEAYGQLGHVLAAQPGGAAGAERAYEAALRLDPRNFAARLGLAQLLAADPDRLYDAIVNARQAVALQPDSPVARALLEQVESRR